MSKIGFRQINTLTILIKVLTASTDPWIWTKFAKMCEWQSLSTSTSPRGIGHGLWCGPVLRWILSSVTSWLETWDGQFNLSELSLPARVPKSILCKVMIKREIIRTAPSTRDVSECQWPAYKQTLALRHHVECQVVIPRLPLCLLHKAVRAPAGQAAPFLVQLLAQLPSQKTDSVGLGWGPGKCVKTKKQKTTKNSLEILMMYSQGLDPQT